MTKQELDQVIDQCFRAVDKTLDREHNASEPGNEHGAHETLEEESDMERERRMARLIAAAPDLLAALQRLTGLIRDCNNVYGNHAASWIMKQESFKQAEAAIATVCQ